MFAMRGYLIKVQYSCKACFRTKLDITFYITMRTCLLPHVISFSAAEHPPPKKETLSYHFGCWKWHGRPLLPLSPSLHQHWDCLPAKLAASCVSASLGGYLFRQLLGKALNHNCQVCDTASMAYGVSLYQSSFHLKGGAFRGYMVNNLCGTQKIVGLVPGNASENGPGGLWCERP